MIKIPSPKRGGSTCLLCLPLWWSSGRPRWSSSCCCCCWIYCYLNNNYSWAYPCMTAIKNVAIHTVFLSILLILKNFVETSRGTQIVMAHFCRMSRLACSCLLIFGECLDSRAHFWCRCRYDYDYDDDYVIIYHLSPNHLIIFTYQM